MAEIPTPDFAVPYAAPKQVKTMADVQPIAPKNGYFKYQHYILNMQWVTSFDVGGKEPLASSGRLFVEARRVVVTNRIDWAIDIVSIVFFEEASEFHPSGGPELAKLIVATGPRVGRVAQET